MFNFLKKKVQPKPVIVAIHGFGPRRAEELTVLKNAFTSLGYEIHIPTLFDIEDDKDVNQFDWIKRAQDVVIDLFQQNKEVILIGYSMGGVIASKIAADLPIKKLILLAPAFSYATLNNAINVMQHVVQPDHRSNSETPQLPVTFVKTFQEIVDKYKSTITAVVCPTLIIHGDADKVVPVISSKIAIKKMTNNDNALIILGQTTHRLLEQDVYGNIAVEIITNFIEDKISLKKNVAEK